MASVKKDSEEAIEKRRKQKNAAAKRYWRTAKGKATNARFNKSEKRKKWNEEYYQRPDVKARQAAHARKRSMTAKGKAYKQRYKPRKNELARLKYQQDPELRKKLSDKSKALYQIKKLNPVFMEAKRQQAKKSSSTPHGKARRKAYRQRPEVKQKDREYIRKRRLDSEFRELENAYKREYGKRPEVLEHRRPLDRIWSKLPHVKAHRNEHDREFFKDPENRERKRAIGRKYAQKPSVKNTTRLYNRAWRQIPEVKERRRLALLQRRLDDEYYANEAMKKKLKKLARE
jgi:hypothetical protein